MRKVRALQVGTAAGAVLVAMMLSVPAAQAACGDYGQPPCPTPTVTPQPPAPSPSPSPRPTASPSATPTPLVTPEPVETTNPEAARVIDGSVVVVSQQTAENTPPRLILQPHGHAGPQRPQHLLQTYPWTPPKRDPHEVHADSQL